MFLYFQLHIRAPYVDFETHVFIRFLISIIFSIIISHKKRGGGGESRVVPEKINTNIENPTEEKRDEDYLFMKSLIPLLKRLNKYSKALGKVQIQALFLKLEFPDKDKTI